MTDKAKRDARARASKRWRWTAGLLATHTHRPALGRPQFRIVGAHGPGPGMWLHGFWYEPHGAILQYEPVPQQASEFEPDTDDPATLGWIEHGLLPELYGPNAALMRGPTGWGYGEGATSIIAVQPTKADALVAALEAAP